MRKNINYKDKYLDAIKEIKMLKRGKCEHIKQGVLSGDCRLCDLAVAEKGYFIWVKKAKVLQAQLRKLRNK